MKHIYLILAVLSILSDSSFGQILGEAPYRLMPEQSIKKDYLPNSGESFRVGANPCNRQQIIDDYNNVYLTSQVSSAELAWDGNIATCNPGTIATFAKTQVIKRINYFRNLVGLPSNMILTTSRDTNEQAAALIMAANNSLSHYPPNTWTCYTKMGYNGAGTSNLCLGAFSSDAVTLYINDFGSTNTVVGHRRWILYSRSTEFGSGSVSGGSGSDALYVFGPTQTPSSLPGFISYPSPGYFPRSLVFQRWSFGIPAADFSTASVTIFIGNNQSVPVPVIQDTYVTGYGDNTLVWEMPTSSITYSTDADVLYTVSISGVKNAPQSSYSYSVMAIKEQTPSFTYTIINPTCTTDGSIILNFPTGASSYLWNNSATNDTLTGLRIGNYSATVQDIYSCPYTSPTISLTDNSLAVISPGSALPNSSVSINCQGVATTNFVATGAKNVKSSQTLGWWITKSNPVGSLISNQSQLNTKIAQSLVNPTTIAPKDSSILYKGNNITKLFTFGTNLDTTNTYFATPIVSINDSPAPLSFSTSTSSIIDDSNVSGSGVNFLNIPVYQLPDSAVLSKVCIVITYANGAYTTLNDLSIWLYSPDSSSIPLTSFFPGADNGKGGMNACYVADNSGATVSNGCNGSCYTGNLNPDVPFSSLGYTPPNGTWKLRVIDDFNPGYTPNFISVTLYFNKPAYTISFPQIAYTPCVFGSPISFTSPKKPKITGSLSPCANSVTALDAGAGFTSYSWNTGAKTESIVPTTNGNYFVTVTNTGGCVYSEQATVNLLPNPIVSLGPDRSFIGNTILSSTGTNGLNYLWSTGATTSSINVTLPGIYSLTVVGANGCSASDTVNINVVTVLFEQGALGKVSIAPNPVIDVLQLTVPNGEDISKIQIVNFAGNTVTETSVNPKESVYHIPVTSYPSGVYIVKLIGVNGVHSIRFVKI